MSTSNVEHRSAEPTQSRPSRPASNNKPVLTSTDSRHHGGSPAIPPADARAQTDDEILGLDLVSDSSPSAGHPGSQPGTDPGDQPAPDQTTDKSSDAQQEPTHLQSILSANPELREAWHDASAYRQSFATPEDARAATAALADLDRMDSLFFSPRAEDHAELARAVAALNPAAFSSLAQAMAKLAGEGNHPATEAIASQTPAAAATGATANRSPVQPTDNRAPSPQTQNGPTPAQEQFFHSANAEAVQGVLDAIESQADRLLPEGISKDARNRVVGEIYRELDSTLRSNQQLARQIRDAFRSGALDDSHRRAIVSLITGRARQALPAAAKRVLNEWTSTVVTASQDRRARQRNAERRVDIAGSGRTGPDAPRPLSSQDIDYSRMSDSDILNL